MTDVAVPWVIDDAGVTVPDLATLRSTTLTALQATDMLGGDYLLHPDDDMTQAIEVVLQQLALAYQLVEVVSSSRDPEQAQGVLLRETGSIVGAEYSGRSRSVVSGRLLGNPGTLVPKGSILSYLPSDPVDMWETFVDATIGANGTVDAELQSVEFGEYTAAAAPNTSWSVQTPVAGWSGFLSTLDSEPGRLEADDAEVREAITLAGRGGAGAATYDADAQNVAAVDGVSYLGLFVNRTLVYDAAQDLDQKRARFIVEGGRKQALLDAIGTTGSTSLNTTDTGTVIGTTTRFDGKVLTVSYSRPSNVPILFRVTLSGSESDGFPQTQAEVEAVVFAAIALRAAEQDVTERVVPEQYRASVVKAFDENAVDSCLVEIRRDVGDPWITTPLTLSAVLAERAVVNTEPAAAEIFGTAEEPIAVTAGMTLNVVTDVAGVLVVFTEDHTTIAGVAAEIEAQAVSVEALDADGRLLLRSVTVGSASGISLIDSTALAALGLSDTQIGEGTDGDVEVVIV